MKIDRNQPILSREERLKLHNLVRKQDKMRRKENPTGRVAGIRRMPNSPEIERFFADITKKRLAVVTRATTAKSST